MKYSLILIIFFTPIVVFAQSNEDWEIGVVGSAFYFTKIDTGKEDIEVGPQDLPNGGFFGLSLAKNWNENWGLSTGLEYSIQNWKARDFYPVQSTGSSVDEDLEYLKLPIMVRYTHSPNKNNFYWVFKQGFQISLLTDYFTVIENNDDYPYTSIYKENRRDYYEGDYFISHENNAYKDFLFGIAGSVGFKNFFSENWSYSADVRYEMDFSRADDEIIRSQYSAAKNFRIGLVFGIQYHFGK